MWRNESTACGNLKLYSTGTMKKSRAAPSKVKYRIVIWLSYSTSGYTSKITESKDLNRYVYTHIQSIFTTAKTEATHMHIDGWSINKMLVYTCEKLYNFKKEWNSEPGEQRILC